MLLAFNIGNTSISFGALDESSLRFRADIAAHPVRTADEYAVLLAQLFALHRFDPAQITDVIIASVVPSLLDAVREAVTRFTAVKPAVVGPGMRTGLQIRIDTPTQLGADLVVLAAGAKKYVRTGPAVIAYLETATTLTVIDADGAICGVVILPGVASSAAALERDTAQLPQILLTPPKRVIGKNTSESIRSGLLWGASAQLDGLVERIAEELEVPVRDISLLAAGSYADRVTPLCRHHFDCHSDLLFTGLSELHHLNRRS
jgi:type III pantothenate kinase